MISLPFKHKLSVKIITPALILLLVGYAGFVCCYWHWLSSAAERDCHDKSIMLMRAHLTTSGTKMSSDTIDKEIADTPYQFKLISRDNSATSQADAYENTLLTTLKADPNVKKIEQDISKGKEIYHVIAVPVTSSDGQNAVAIIYLPTNAIFARSRQLFENAAEFGALIGMLCVGLVIWTTHKLVTQPAQAMFSSSEAIHGGDWTQQFSIKTNDEMSTLAFSFQSTTWWLRQQVAREEKLRAMFQQFVPASVAALALGRNAEDVMAGAKRPVTVMIINIRNFKLLMEHLPPEETVSTLNEFFSEVNQVIVAHRGMVSKYMGDSIMAFFGVPLGNKDHPLLAIRAALALPQALQDMYVRLDEKHGWELGIGIGISTGEPIVGHFGSSEHMEYTVLGEVVVEAHAMESASKAVPEEDTILISESTYRCVMSDVHVFDIGEKPMGHGNIGHAYVVQGLRSEARKALAA